MTWTEDPRVERNAFGEISLDVVRARHRAAMTHRCGCRSKALPSELKRVGSRSWISCNRCLGTIRQVS